MSSAAIEERRKGLDAFFKAVDSMVSGAVGAQYSAFCCTNAQPMITAATEMTTQPLLTVTLPANPSDTIGLKLKDKGIIVEYVDAGSAFSLAGVEVGMQLVRFQNKTVTALTWAQLENIIMGQSDAWVFCFALVPFSAEMIVQWSAMQDDMHARALTPHSDEDEDDDDQAAAQRRDSFNGMMEA